MKRKKFKGSVALLGAAALASVAVHGAHASGATITQDSLAPTTATAGQSVSATLHVHSSSCTTVQALTVAVRDSNNNNVDFPGAVNNARICPSGYTLNTLSRTFTAGTYTEYGAYEVNNQWHSLTMQTLTVTSGGSPTAPSWNPTGTYTSTFADEFNATSVDNTKWEKGWFLGLNNSGITQPVNSQENACYDSNNVTEPGDGSLHLTLKNTPSTCQGSSHPYTGALADTRPDFSQAGGSFEARVFIPSDSGGTQAAAWPAWWQNGPDSDPWPHHGEIDTVEGLSGSTDIHLHYVDGQGVEQSPGFTMSPTTVGWHNFGEKWDATAQTVTFYLDGVQVWTHAFNATLPEYLIFDYSNRAGTPNPASFPSDMKVDWVRTWTP